MSRRKTVVKVSAPCPEGSGLVLVKKTRLARALNYLCTHDQHKLVADLREWIGFAKGKGLDRFHRAALLANVDNRASSERSSSSMPIVTNTSTRKQRRASASSSRAAPSGSASTASAKPNDSSR